MKSIFKTSKLQRAMTGLEVPVVYSLTAFTAAVSLLVYGTTMLRSGGDGGLLGFLKPIFGMPYSLIGGAVLVAILAVNRRSKVLVVLGLGELLHFLMMFSPTGGREFNLSEHLNVSLMIACLLAFSCIHYELVEEPDGR